MTPRRLKRSPKSHFDALSHERRYPPLRRRYSGFRIDDGELTLYFGFFLKVEVKVEGVETLMNVKEMEETERRREERVG